MGLSDLKQEASFQLEKYGYLGYAQHIPKDFSLWSLIISNIFAIFVAVKEHWSLLLMLYIYWWQTCVIVFFYFFKALIPKHLSNNEGVSDKKLWSNNYNLKDAFSFLFTFVFFQSLYLLFILKEVEFKNINMRFVYCTILLFFLNHFFSFLYNLKRDREKEAIIAEGLLPFLRIFPMHIIIIFAFDLAMSVSALVFFLLLKTSVDVLFHIVEHADKRFIAKIDTTFE